MESALKLSEQTRVQFVPEGKVITTYIIDCLKKSNDKIIYSNGFMVYSNGYWKKIEDINAIKLIQDFAKDEGHNEQHWKYYKKAEDLLAQAKLDLYVPLETNRNLLNFQNGTLELDTMLFREHRKEDYLQYILPYEYNPKAEYPKWQKFLDEVLPEKELQVALQEGFAYPLSRLHLEKLIYLVGDGRNGKSVSLEVLAEVIGKENVSSVSLSSITKNTYTDFGQMEEKLINISNDNAFRLQNTDILKSYISQENITIKRLYENTYSTKNYPQTILAANSLPISDDFSHGFFSRIRPIPFNIIIPEERINPNLKNELCQELSGICNWLIEGIVRLRKNGKFTKSEVIDSMHKHFRDNSDIVKIFIDENFYMPSNTMKKELSLVYREFEDFVKVNNYHIMSSKTFAGRLRALGFTIKRGTGNKNVIYYDKIE